MIDIHDRPTADFMDIKLSSNCMYLCVYQSHQWNRLSSHTFTPLNCRLNEIVPLLNCASAQNTARSEGSNFRNTMLCGLQYMCYMSHEIGELYFRCKRPKYFKLSISDSLHKSRLNMNVIISNSALSTLPLFPPKFWGVPFGDIKLIR